jgi:hypothetical protein
MTVKALIAQRNSRLAGGRLEDRRCLRVPADAQVLVDRQALGVRAGWQADMAAGRRGIDQRLERSSRTDRPAGWQAADYYEAHKQAAQKRLSQSWFLIHRTPLVEDHW